jgi:hypothetical protein
MACTVTPAGTTLGAYRELVAFPPGLVKRSENRIEARSIVATKHSQQAPLRLINSFQCSFLGPFAPEATNEVRRRYSLASRSCLSHERFHRCCDGRSKLNRGGP